MLQLILARSYLEDQSCCSSVTPDGASVSKQDFIHAGRLHTQPQTAHVPQTHAGGHQTLQECPGYTMLATEAEPLEHDSESAAAHIWVRSAAACFYWI